MSAISRSAARLYYHISFAGTAVPRSGPVLLVANHPNSLFDPVLVIAAARRPIRFLAKAPLFSDPKVGWLVRGSGSIPVYRRSDDPTLLARNDEMFSAVSASLGAGDAVALFPEGISHSESTLTPLKTGAARIALDFASRNHRALPILPVGLVLRDKETFRSEAQVVIGKPVSWDDLATAAPSDAHAVRALTNRIARALRTVTVNLKVWADQPVVECALDVWEAGREPPVSPEARVARMEVTTKVLAAVRATPLPANLAVLASVGAHDRRLRRLGLRPQDLNRDVSSSAALRWSVRRLLWLSPPALALGMVGYVLFWAPYRATGWIAGLMNPEPDQSSTYKLLVGIPAYGLWIAALAVTAGLWLGPLWGVLTLLAVPVVGLWGLRIRERWRGAWADARGYALLRARRKLVADLAGRQAALAADLDDLLRAYGGAPDPPDEASPAPPPDGTG